MEQGALYEEFSALLAARNLPELTRLSRRIPDDHPRAAEMLNCIGVTLCLDAKTGQELTGNIALLERAATLSADSLIQAKIFTNLAAFYNWSDLPRKSIAAAEQVLQQPLDDAYLWAKALVQFHAGQAWLALGNYEAAQRTFRDALTGSVSHACIPFVHMFLAMFAACQGDTQRADEHLNEIRDLYMKPYADGVRARLALRQGDVQSARELAHKSLQRLAAMDPSPSTWATQLEARALYIEALTAAGERMLAEHEREILMQLNGGTSYTSIWEGLLNET